MQDYFLTAALSSQLAQAGVLAQWIKKHHPEAKVVLALADAPNEQQSSLLDSFDEIFQLASFAIEDKKHWLFKRTSNQAVSALKARAMKQLLERTDCRTVISLAANCVLSTPLHSLFDCLKLAPAVLAPNLVSPQKNPLDVSREMAILRDGVYSPALLAVLNGDEGRRLAAWLCDRLGELWDERQRLTEQRWMDLIPSFFQTAMFIEPGWSAGDFHAAPWQFDYFDNGETITEDHRKFLREHAYLKSVFADPFDTKGSSFLAWYNEQTQKQQAGPTLSPMHHVLSKINRKLLGALKGGAIKR